MERTIGFTLEAVQVSFGFIFDSFFPDDATHLLAVDGIKAVLREIQHCTNFQTTQLFYNGTFLHMWLRTGIPKHQEHHCSGGI